MKVIHTDNAPKAVGPYSQAILAGNTLYVSGQIPVNPTTSELVMDVKGAAKQSLANIESILKEAGFSKENVVKVAIFLADMSYFAEVNEVYGEFFSQPYPARSCVAVKGLPKGAPLEIECIAVK